MFKPDQPCWSLDDPKPIQAEAPYTYFLPHTTLLDAVRRGDWVKAIFRPIPNDRKFDAERMWVLVELIDEAGFRGKLDSDPSDIPQLPIGTECFVPKHCVIDVE